jgi:phosphatidylethanolamine-binding protein (PEBP) family uncharacterized protein
MGGRAIHPNWQQHMLSRQARNGGGNARIRPRYRGPFFPRAHGIVLYLFYRYFVKIYGRPQILQNIHLPQSGNKAVAHGGSSRQEWARTLNVAGHGVVSLTPWVTALGA